MAPAPAIVGEVVPIMTVEPAPTLVLPEPVVRAPSLFGLTPFSAPPRRVSRRGPNQDQSQLRWRSEVMEDRNMSTTATGTAREVGPRIEPV